MNSTPLLLDFTVVYRRIGIPKSTAYRLLGDGRFPLPTQMLGGALKVKTADFEAYSRQLSTVTPGIEPAETQAEPGPSRKGPGRPRLGSKGGA